MEAEGQVRFASVVGQEQIFELRWAGRAATAEREVAGSQRGDVVAAGLDLGPGDAAIAVGVEIEGPVNVGHWDVPPDADALLVVGGDEIAGAGCVPVSGDGRGECEQRQGFEVRKQTLG